MFTIATHIAVSAAAILGVGHKAPAHAAVRHTPRPAVVTIHEGTTGRVDVRRGQRFDVVLNWRPTVAAARTACANMGATLVESATGLDQVCRGVDF